MPPKKGKDKEKKEEETAMAVSEGKNALGHRLSDVLTDEQKELIKKCFAKNATDDELAIYFNFCEKAGVDPLRGQSHFIKYNPKDKPIMMIGIDGFQARAVADPRYISLTASAVYENDDFKMDMTAGEVSHSFGVKNRGDIVGAYAILERKGMKNAVEWVAFKEYDLKKNLWQTKKEVMIKKVARATLRRREYPDNFSGIYVPEEFSGEITDKGDFVDHSKKKPEPFPNGHVPKKVEPQPEPEIQEAEFRDVEPEAEEPEEEEEDEGEKLPDIPEDVVDDDMTPRDALKAIMDYGWKNEVGHIVRPVIEKHYDEWKTGEPDVWNIPEPNVIAMVQELTGKKLKRAEKDKKCKDCSKKITEPEAEEQDDLCLVCYKRVQESEDDD